MQMQQRAAPVPAFQHPMIEQENSDAPEVRPLSVKLLPDIHKQDPLLVYQDNAPMSTKGALKCVKSKESFVMAIPLDDGGDSYSIANPDRKPHALTTAEIRGNQHRALTMSEILPRSDLILANSNDCIMMADDNKDVTLTHLHPQATSASLPPKSWVPTNQGKKQPPVTEKEIADFPEASPPMQFFLHKSIDGEQQRGKEWQSRQESTCTDHMLQSTQQNTSTDHVAE